MDRAFVLIAGGVALTLSLLMSGPSHALEIAATGPAFEVHAESRYDDPVTGLSLAGFCCVPQMGGDQEGNILVTWTGDPSKEGIGARRFGADGKAASPFIAINGILHEDHYDDEYGGRAVVKPDAAGNFVVAWSDYGDDDYEGADGYTANVARIPVGQNKTVARKRLSRAAYTELGLATNEGGEFFVVWLEDYAVVGRRGAGNSLRGPAFPVNEIPVEHSYASGPELAVDGLGRWMVTWEATYRDEIRGRIFDSGFSPATSEFAIGTGPIDEPDLGGVIPLDDGGFVVTWRGYGTDANGGQTFDSNGVAGAQFSIAATDVREVVASRADAEHFVVAWYEYDYEGDVDVFTQLHRNDGTPEGAPFIVDSSAEGGGYPYLAIANRGDGLFAVAWDGDYPTAEVPCRSNRCGLMSRLLGIAPEAEEHLLPGRKLLITNRVPDAPEKNKVTWQIKDDSIPGIGMGGFDDPRCLFDPAGTVKASVRFRSSTSGQDTGAIPLPCQHWQAFGKSPRTSWKYREKSLVDGPCDQVLLKAGKSLKITCKGKSGVQSFPYDLTPGISEGPVDAVLTIGSKSYCTSFPPVGPLDGSDGKRFLGRKAAAPGACPTP